MAVINRMPGTRSRVMSETLGSPAVGTNTAIHAAVTDNGAPQVITTAITNPDVPRNVTATTGGTNTDVKAIQVIVTGTNAYGDVITETLPAFTVDTTGTVVGSKAFKTVTSITIPAHDGTGATTAIGTGVGGSGNINAKLGIPVKLDRDTIVAGFLNGVRESTRPVIAFSSTAVESNTVYLASALNGTPVIVDYYT
ncbi:hypothetical protein SAMN05442782_2357 [Streptomyces sp. OK228]|nr:hypothetical protein SAMN05442782_2357 [Streptomyces sp. OK228]